MPEANCVINSSFASLRFKIPIIFPSNRTAIRLPTDKTSITSELIIIMLTPSSLANRSKILYIATFAPTSIPLVGSSIINILGLYNSHLANDTFC